MEDPRSDVLWLHGPAGAGKSAIAQSFSQKLVAEGRLGGSFFKRGDPSRGNGRNLFPTIAYQLAQRLPQLKKEVSQRVEDDPSIVNKSLSAQLQWLIIEPFRKCAPTHTFIIIIDGLDECEGQHLQQEILRSLGNSLYRSHLPLRFLVASRPEPDITDVFREPCLYGIHRPVNIRQSFNDVQRYLQDEFGRIHRQHRQTMARIPTPWPSPIVIQHLVDKSSGYFLYASTVIKFIDDKNFCPTERLEIIMGITEPDAESGSPFEALDQLYTHILISAPARSRVIRILTVIASIPAPFSSSVQCIEHLLNLKSGNALLALRGLHSVLDVPDSEDVHEESDQHDPSVLVHHNSFRDFLHDPKRSGVFHVGGRNHTQLACEILKMFSYTHNISTVNVNAQFPW
jgi:hypothetical protein